MAVRGSGARRDPESMLDAAMNETLQEIASQGSGIEAEDVVRAPSRRSQGQQRPQRGGDERDQSRAAERPRDPDTGQFVPTRSERRQSSQDDAVDAYDILGDQEEDQDEERARRRAPQRRRASAPPAYDDQDADDLDDDEDDDEEEAVVDGRSGQRRRRAADEDEEEDDDLDPEGGYDPEDDGEEGYDDGARGGRRGRADDDEDDADGDPRERRGSRKKRFSKRVEREIAQEVRRQVGRVLSQNQQMAAEQERRQKIDNELGEFITAAIGTPQRRQQLEEVVLNTRLPQAQRDKASNELLRYRNNQQYLDKYKAAADAVSQHETRENLKAAVKAMAELKALDPKVVATGDPAKITINAYVTGRLLGQQEAAEEIKKLRRRLANARAGRDERSVRSLGDDRRPARLASSGSRRANGRTGRADPLSGALSKSRGIGRGSEFAAPTDELLTAFKNGDMTFEKLRMGRVKVG